MEFSITFAQLLFLGFYLTAPVLIMLLLLIVSLGFVVGWLESWKKFEAIYWAFITALTVGYGDFRPVRKASRIISIFIAGIGIMFTGIIVAITVQTATIAFEQHADPEIVQDMEFLRTR